MKLSSEIVAQIGDLNNAVEAIGVRYRAYTLVTIDQRVMADIALYLQDAFNGQILDALDRSLTDGSLVAVPPMKLVDWVSNQIKDEKPRSLLHVDAVLSTWRNADHHVWWEQMSMLERPGALYILSARPEVRSIPRWGEVGTFWVDTIAVTVWAPRAAQHFGRLTEEVQ